MKRYLLFCGHNYYPHGGWDDFIGSYDTLEEALEDITAEWYHVIDGTNGQRVKEHHGF
jgi:hypothetical protein